MGLAVVRCPECRGTAQIEADAVGLTVLCPRCNSTFEAVEEMMPARAARNPTLQPSRAEHSDRSARPHRRRSRRERDREPAPPPEPDHDPHRIPPGPLPVSVLIGLALLPFAIPVLWLVGPVLIGEPPVLSLATPIALAISASVLCLAVIYTIDWTPATRVKGVLMLVCVAYFAAVNLYFLKKEMVDKVKSATGLDDFEWQDFRPKGGEFVVKMPGRPVEFKEQPLPRLLFKCFKSSYKTPILGQYDFVVGFCELPAQNAGINNGDPEPGSQNWYKQAIKDLEAHSGGRVDSQQEVLEGRGREFVIKLPGEGDVRRVVRLYVIQGYIYYLSVQGRGMYPDEDDAKRFLGSFYCERVKD